MYKVQDLSKGSIIDQMKTLDLLIHRDFADEVSIVNYHKSEGKQFCYYPQPKKSIYIGLDALKGVDYVGKTEQHDPFKRPQMHFKDKTKDVVEIRQIILPDWVDLAVAETYLIRKLKPRANKIWAGGLPISAHRWIKIIQYWEQYHNKRTQTLKK